MRERTICTVLRRNKCHKADFEEKIRDMNRFFGISVINNPVLAIKSKPEVLYCNFHSKTVLKSKFDSKKASKLYPKSQNEPQFMAAFKKTPTN